MEAKKARSYESWFLRVGFIFKKSIGSTRGFLIMFFQKFPRLGTIGCLTLSLKREEVVILQARI